MHFRVYYLFERAGESVSSASAIEMSARDIREQLLPRFQSEGDYLGLIDSQDRILQILPEPDLERFWVELPIDDARASHGCHMNLERLREFLMELPAVFDPAAIPGFEYRPW